jgi:hypothetical protein
LLISLRKEAKAIRAWLAGRPADDAAREFPREQEKPLRTMKAIAEYCDVHEDEIDTPGTLCITWAKILPISGMSRHTFEEKAKKAGVDICHDKRGRVQLTLEAILKVKFHVDESKK